MSALARLATLIHVPMDNMFLESFFFFVPNRLVWDNWQKFMGEQENPGDSVDFLIPQVVTTPAVGSIMDYMGLPTGTELSVSALPQRAYRKIWNDWFRDENINQSDTVFTDDGPDSLINGGTLNKRGKRHDYFTSSLPFPQKGPGVDLPLGVRADVKGIGLTGFNAAGAPRAQ